MVITVNIYYQSINGNAKKFAEEMISSGIVNEIRSENGNIRYDYFSQWMITKLCFSLTVGTISTH